MQPRWNDGGILRLTWSIFCDDEHVVLCIMIMRAVRVPLFHLLCTLLISLTLTSVGGRSESRIRGHQPP